MDSTSGDSMAFKPNYGRDRAERARSSRAQVEEKQRKRDEKTALRKAKRADTEAPAEPLPDADKADA
jgi:hypothetical protein